MDIGLVGGIFGGTLGVLGGVVGTYFSIRNTNGPRERAFMIKVAIVAWVVIAAFLFGLFIFPRPYNLLLWLPYGIMLPLGIIWSNRRQRQIRADEAAGR